MFCSVQTPAVLAGTRGRCRRCLKRSVSRAGLAAALTVWASRAGAHPGAQAATPQNSKAESQPTATAGPEGFVLQSTNGDYRLQLGVLLHADGRFSPDDKDETFSDSFLIRRARTYVRGRLARHFEFYVNPDFAGGTLVLQDAYIDTRFSRAFTVRFGKAKTPFAMERLQPVPTILFYERALPSQLAPNRDIGVQVLGELHGGLISYIAGVVNGVPDGASGDTDTNDGKDLAGRVLVRPFVTKTASPLGGLRLAIAGTTGNQNGLLGTIRTTSLAQAFVSYAGNVSAGRVNRVSPAASFEYKRVSMLAEFVRTNVPMLPSPTLHPGAPEDSLGVHDVSHEAWQVAGAVLVTPGTMTADRGVVPLHNFDFGAGHWGAFQVSARYHALTVDDDAFIYKLASSTSSQTAKAWTVNLNWYLNGNVRYVGVFERTTFGGTYGAPRPPENALAFRVQVFF
jgi:phosphate-selective porin OprO/OprP